MLEKDIERRFVDGCEALGLVAVKLKILGWVGWPDRLVLGLHRFIVFVELKRPGETPRPTQCKVHDLLRRFGFHVIVADTVKDALEGIRAAAAEVAPRAVPKKRR